MFRATNRQTGPANGLNVDQIGILAGEAQQNPPNMQAFDAETMRARGGRGDLYVLVDVPYQAAWPGDLYSQVILTVAQTYYGLSGSITRGLREAIIQANELLYERNLRADSEHRTVAGINCAVLRDSDLYIAQLGPALTTILSAGALSRYPSDSIWLHSDAPGAFDMKREPPAGLRREAEPDLFHANLGPSDLAILSTTSLPRLVSDSDLLEAAANTQARSAREVVEHLAQGRELSVLILGWPDYVARAEATVVAKPPEPATRFAAPEPEPLVVEEPEREEPPARPAPLPPPLEEDDLEPDDAAWDPQGFPIRGRDEAPVGPEPPHRAPQPRVNLGDIRETLGEGAERLRQGTEDVLQRVLPDKLPERPVVRPSSAPGISLSGRALVAIALAIPLVMLFIVLMTRAQYERVREAQFRRVQSLAQQRYDAAMRAQDATLRRQELYNALAKVREGRAVQPHDEMLESLERNILHRLDEVDSVTRIYYRWVLHQFEGPDVALDTLSDSSRIVINGIDVYLLNKGSDRVFKFLLNDVGDALQTAGTNPVLVQRGEMRGGVRLGDMVDIAWMEAGGDRTLSTFVVLERTGSLLAYDPQQGIDVLPVADSDRWLKPEAIGSYYGNLYVLDPLMGHILKYVPIDNVYTQPPSLYVSPHLSMDLTGAVDMTIDGNIYVLFADGRIEKFFNGEPRPFTMAGLPSPMDSPTTIFVSGEKEPEAEGSVFVTDAGNERILQFDKNGAFIRQYRDKPGDMNMDDLRGIYVDQERKRMFVLNGAVLWQANLTGEKS